MKKTSYLYPALTALLFLSVAFINGFPLVEGDTGNYIATGVEDIISPDRTPFYGIFLRKTSMWSSLWFTALAQCLLLSYALVRYIKMIFGKEIPAGIYFALCIMIAGFTSASWMASFLMPDIFTAILLLLVALYLHEKSGFLRNEVVYPILIFGVIAIHNSHFLIIAVLSVLLITGALLKKNYTVVRKALTMLTLAIGFFFLMCNMNLNYGNKFTFSKGSHVFMITKFAETGILKAYLDDNCEKKHLKLCNFKDNIHPVSWIFLWDDNSPLTVTGGWDANEREDKEIINDVFTTPKYATLFAQKSLIYTAKQLFTVGVPDITTIQGTNSMPYRMIAANFSDETGEYITAKQNSTGFHGDTCNIVYIFFFAVTSLIVLSFSGIMVSPGIRRIYSFVLIYLVVNAFVSATFSTVLPRYQCRVFWLLPATNIIVIARHLYYKMAGKVIGESKVI